MAHKKRRAVDVLAAASAGASPKPAPDAEQVTQKRDGDVLEARSTSRRIKTVEDLLRHIEADLERYEVAASEATKWEVGTSDGDGGTTVTELHRVFVRLKPRGGPTTREIVEAMIAGASGGIRRPLTKAVKAPKRDGLWQVLPVSDTHFGGYAWGQTTGAGDWDLSIAERVVGQAAGDLLAIGDTHEPTRRTVAFLGDLFHYDRAERAETSSGTPLERDGRLQKMIQVGADVLLGIVERSAETCPTDVVLVHGNHDEMLSWVFLRILQERFRNDRRVKIDERYTGRKYLTHGKTLLGFCHGHKAKKRLPQLMALEAAEEWARCPYREWHTGHYHSSAAEWSRPIETLDGVLTRVSPSLCAPDDWHASHGFINTRQCMETFIYAAEGGLTAMHVSTPKGTR
jgi:UDP-2,3-diacylglucosamine pyrophosphatase LpxH